MKKKPTKLTKRILQYKIFKATYFQEEVTIAILSEDLKANGNDPCIFLSYIREFDIPTKVEQIGTMKIPFTLKNITDEKNLISCYKMTDTISE